MGFPELKPWPLSLTFGLIHPHSPLPMWGWPDALRRSGTRVYRMILGLQPGSDSRKVAWQRIAS
jgi:hypothetical protein